MNETAEDPRTRQGGADREIALRAGREGAIGLHQTAEEPRGRGGDETSEEPRMRKETAEDPRGRAGRVDREVALRAGREGCPPPFCQPDLALLSQIKEGPVGVTGGTQPS